VNESGGASGFFGTPDRAKDLQDSIDAREEAFEARAVRALLKKFGIKSKGWEGDEGLKFGRLDENHPSFPVRLSAEKVVARNRGAEKRYVGSLAFHELEPNVLFKLDQFKKTQVFKSWQRLREEPSVDGRPVGLVFLCVGTLYVIHEWGDVPQHPGVRLEVNLGGHKLTVQPFDHFLEQVWDSPWRPD